jgi:hypothetical protein
MVIFKVGDIVEMRASLDDFCGTYGNAYEIREDINIYEIREQIPFDITGDPNEEDINIYEIRDINIALPPCSINTFTPECLNFSGINISFGWTTVSRDPNLNVCPAILKVLGSATTNAQGVATLQYTITQNDLDLYNVNISSFDLAACITNSTIDIDNAIRRRFRSGDAITIISSPISTHILDLTISPYSWYTPQGAADYLVSNLVGINGAIVNWLTPLTGWTFLYIEIINDGTNVIIRVHLNDGSVSAAPEIISASNMQTLVAPVAVGELIVLAVLVGVIFIAVGVVFAVTLIKLSTGNKDAAKQFTAEDVIKMVISDPDSIVASQLARCDTNFPADAVGLRLCYNSIIVGAQDGLVDKIKLPPPKTNTPTETQKCFDQYIIDSNWANYQTCLKAVSGKAGDELLASATCPSGQYYNVDQGKCVSTEECWIYWPAGGCILTAKPWKTVALIGGVVIGGYIIFRFIKK